MFPENHFSSFLVLLVVHLVMIIQAGSDIKSNVTNNLTLSLNGTFTNTTTSSKNILAQGEQMIHKFANMDRGMLIRASIVLAGITGLIVMYIGVKTLVMRKRRQPKRYTLINHAGTGEEPLFGAHDDDEEEMEDDTLYVRK